MLQTIILLYIAVDAYVYCAARAILKSKKLKRLYILISALVLLFFVMMFLFRRNPSLRFIGSYAFGILLVFFTLKFTIALFFLAEDGYRLIVGAFRCVFARKQKKEAILPSRRKFVAQVAVGVAAVPFLGLIYGMIKGRYNFKVFRHTLYFEDLPDAFDGYRITQISDIHLGSFDNREQVAYAIYLVNQQQGDIILFTGDLVNERAVEVLPWMTELTSLKAKDGVFSVLGNHDYGTHYDWSSRAEKAQNLNHLKALQKELGFDLLLNESRYIKRGDHKLALVGVENWGYGKRFPKKANLGKAVQHIDKNDFKILMSHDPTHWQYKVLPHDYHYHLTLSGHTHGAQMGVEIPGVVRWSPAKWFGYKYWAGIYNVDGQYINVNRGLGTIGYPGRVGIWPEITLIELKKGKPA